jgi:hypothetical protein
VRFFFTKQERQRLAQSKQWQELDKHQALIAVGTPQGPEAFIALRVAQFNCVSSGKTVYNKRRRKAFIFRDGLCCERVCRAIESLSDHNPADELTYPTRLS